MTLEEFKNTRMGAGDKFKYIKDGNIYDIVALDFDEALFAYWPENKQQETMWWVRCESAEFIPFKESGQLEKGNE